ncbi:MAG: hypothetical protein SPK50_06495 [Mobiluncus porci]|uniref:hypothetical protein n=1 Tax=Mobiluncus porci TaxID=2652278 RepID=UPI0023F35574|nr:hypothetical protein [Mobiluncus porci]MDD7540637.1 hypothetical protein [Mobiluncus porci]MDY5748762.1 hypothetical protein [Mobiluncus porci]
MNQILNDRRSVAQRGANTLEYVGIVLVAAALIVAIVSAVASSSIAAIVQSAVCRLTNPGNPGSCANVALDASPDDSSSMSPPVLNAPKAIDPEDLWRYERGDFADMENPYDYANKQLASKDILWATDMKQQQIGDCYLASTMFGLAATKKGSDILRSRIKRHPPDEDLPQDGWTVKIQVPGYDENGVFTELEKEVIVGQEYINGITQGDDPSLYSIYEMAYGIANGDEELGNGGWSEEVLDSFGTIPTAKYYNVSLIDAAGPNNATTESGNKTTRYGFEKKAMQSIIEAAQSEDNTVVVTTFSENYFF